MGKVKKAQPVTASSTFNVLGTYEGEVLDSNITNKNGLDITAEVIEEVLASEDYKDGIENGWFIGYLGHPEDPNCMEFERGCIVMTEMSLHDDGKVYGKFNLIDTPVGQIVKKFQDAGVNFGISIRGAGDIVNNSVDPETFVFRGFDLVSFPAYPESIPTFKAIAASTKLTDRKKYQAVCNAVKQNLDSIYSSTTIDVLQSQFAPQSEEYKLLESRRHILSSTGSDDVNLQKIAAMTNLYLEALDAVHTLESKLESCRRDAAISASYTNRKIAALERITSSQIRDALDSLDAVNASQSTLKRRIRVLGSQLSDAKKALSKAEKTNLIYKQKIESSTDTISRKDKVIADLRTELRETVTASSDLEVSTSNLGEDNKKLRAEIAECTRKLQEFQSAYLDLYANALGVDPRSLSVSASTTVSDIHKLVASATNTVNLPSTVVVEPVYLVDEDYDDDELVTM